MVFHLFSIDYWWTMLDKLKTSIKNLHNGGSDASDNGQGPYEIHSPSKVYSHPSQ